MYSKFKNGHHFKRVEKIIPYKLADKDQGEVKNMREVAMIHKIMLGKVRIG